MSILYLFEERSGIKRTKMEAELLSEQTQEFMERLGPIIGTIIGSKGIFIQDSITGTGEYIQDPITREYTEV